MNNLSLSELPATLRSGIPTVTETWGFPFLTQQAVCYEALKRLLKVYLEESSRSPAPSLHPTESRHL